MQRHGFLYEHTFSRAGLWQGYCDARRSKGGRRACFQFERHLGSELEALHEELATGRYLPKPYFQFMVYEPKPRTIHAPAFRDCVVQHAIYNAVRPIFDRTFIDTSFACRPGRGTHMAADYAQAALQRSAPGSYTLQLDIRKFFYRINRQTLRRLVERKLKDQRLIDVMMMFAASPGDVGIPIGNLLSQLYALIYMNPVDHFVTRQLKPASGYCRYVDDFILFGLTRQQAVDHRQRIIEFLRDNLQLELSRGTIAPTRRGVNFVGFRTWANARFVRKHSLFKARRAIKSGSLPAIMSHLGHARQTHSLRHLITLIREQNHAVYRALPEAYHPRNHPRAAGARGLDRAMPDRRLDVCEPA